MAEHMRVENEADVAATPESPAAEIQTEPAPEAGAAAFVSTDAGGLTETAPPPSKRRRWLILGGVLIGGVVLASLGGQAVGGSGERTKRVEVLKPRKGRISTSIQAPGTIQAGSEVGIGAPFEGKVLKLVKDTGDHVKQDEIVFQLDPKDYKESVVEAEIDQIRKGAALAEAVADRAETERLNKDKQTEPSDLTEARLRLRQSQLEARRAKAQLESADSRLKRATNMRKKGIGTAVDVESAASEQRVASISVRIADEQLALAKKTLEFRLRSWKDTRAQASKNLTISRTRHARAVADQRAAKITLERARRDVGRCDVRSPISGVITSRGVNQGDLVSRLVAATPHYRVSDLEHLLVYSDVDEGDVVKVKQGQRARVTVNALGEKVELWGKVYSVGYRAQRAQGEEVSTFLVRVLLKPKQKDLARLRPGMSANVEIEVGNQADALKVPIQAVQQLERRELPKDYAEKLPAAFKAKLKKKALEGEEDDLLDVVYVVKDGEAVLRVVERGIQDGDEVEIKVGLEPDLPVVLGPYRVLKKLKPGDRLKTEDTKNAPPDNKKDRFAGVGDVASATPTSETKTSKTQAEKPVAKTD